MKQDLKHIIFLVLTQRCFKALCFQFHKSNVAWWPWMTHKITFWCGNAVFHLITSIQKQAQIANSHDTCINSVISKLNACHKDPNISDFGIWFWTLDAVWWWGPVMGSEIANFCHRLTFGCFDFQRIFLSWQPCWNFASPRFLGRLWNSIWGSKSWWMR